LGKIAGWRSRPIIMPRFTGITPGSGDYSRAGCVMQGVFGDQFLRHWKEDWGFGSWWGFCVLQWQILLYHCCRGRSRLIQLHPVGGYGGPTAGSRAHRRAIIVANLKRISALIAEQLAIAATLAMTGAGWEDWFNSGFPVYQFLAGCLVSLTR
jgi:hypothetical protein